MVKNVESAYNGIAHAQPQWQITAEASGLGWGAECEGVSSGGNWTHLESNHHINYLEMLAIFLGLKTFAKDKDHTHNRVIFDNTTVVNIVNHMETIHYEKFHFLAKEIWEWCIAKNMWVRCSSYPRQTKPFCRL